MKENNSHTSNVINNQSAPQTNKPNMSPFVSLRGTAKSLNQNGGSA